jgi:ATP-dependent helicase HrpB
MAPLYEQPMTELPIDASIPRITEALARRSLVLVAPPGAGKTTRVPPAILQSGLLSADHPTVIVLQPRRVAARAAAVRIAEERSWSLGQEVGYQVRFERRFSAKTRLRFLTEGILTRQLLADPFLDTIGAVVLDEFHERNLNGDLALALLRQIQRDVRPDLIVMVMSATIDALPVARFLDGCPILRVDGNAHEVSLEYRPADRPASAEAIVPLVEERLSDADDSGHLLVFLPGAAEIRRVGKRLEPAAERKGAIVLPLHGSLPSGEQDRVLRPSERRKIILSTNVAETSLTIDGVTTVIDSGLARMVRYDGERGIDRWELYRISRASADQRAGRAGRTGPGRCIRLWSERDQRGRREFEQPEIHRVDLCATVLALHSWGVSDPGRFEWYDPPSPERLAAAGRLLLLLGGVAGDAPRITPVGEAMLGLPVHPRLARLLVEAGSCGRARDGASVAALLSEKDIRVRDTFASAGVDGARRATAGGVSDVLDRLDLLGEAESARFAPSLRSRGVDPAAARQVVLLRDLLLGRDRHRTVGNSGTGDPIEDEAILKWLLLAYPDRVVKRRGLERTGVMVGGRGVRLGPESVVRDAEMYLALDAREDRRAGLLEIQVSLASMVRLEWLEELFPAHVRRERLTRYEESRRRVVSSTRLWYHDLLLREDANPAVDPEEAGLVLALALRSQAPSLFRSNPRAAHWLARLEFLRQALPEWEWPEFNDHVLAELLERICQGKSGLDQVERVDFIPFLESRLTFVQTRELHVSAPQALTVPSGRRLPLAYEQGRPPILAARLQELFGWTETPRLAQGRVPVLLHLLGPNNRPVQITSDLHSFWSTTYHQVRKDLRARYPKHAWPEDPFQAQPPAQGKRM